MKCIHRVDIRSQSSITRTTPELYVISLILGLQFRTSRKWGRNMRFPLCYHYLSPYIIGNMTTFMGVPVTLWGNEVLPYLTIFDFLPLRRTSKEWDRGCLCLLQFYLPTLTQIKLTLVQTVHPLRTTIEEMRAEAKAKLACIQDSDITAIHHSNQYPPVLFEALIIIMIGVKKKTSNIASEFRKMSSQRVAFALLEMCDSEELRDTFSQSFRWYLLKYSQEDAQNVSPFIALVRQYWEILLIAVDIETEELLEMERKISKLEKEEGVLTRVIASTQSRRSAKS